jgi:mRNA-degrading endonuclease toxin of MazEF toxin-antitoxin module
VKSSWFGSTFTKRLAAKCVGPFVGARITRGTDFDLALRYWREAGLNVTSTILIHKLSVLAKVDVVRRLGQLAGIDRAPLAEVLRRAFSFDH